MHRLPFHINNLTACRKIIFYSDGINHRCGIPPQYAPSILSG
tara:strand:+ start:193 stop:318 length:126 start_codon:yes stop_codon:yes gene_type:complete